MLVYSVIMFLAAVLLLASSIAIYRGKTDLIHDYHQTRVTDKKAYGKAFGKALSSFVPSLLLSGVIGLFGSSRAIALAAVTVLFVGLAVGMRLLIAVQKKYNKGVF